MLHGESYKLCALRYGRSVRASLSLKVFAIGLNVRPRFGSLYFKAESLSIWLIWELIGVIPPMLVHPQDVGSHSCLGR